MNKTLKYTIYVILTFGAIVIASNIYLNHFLKNKLQNFIEERLPENMIRAYESITVETISGSLSITNASLIIHNKKDSVQHTFINVEKLNISDISYWDYLFNDEIHVESISLENPIIAYYQDRQLPVTDTVRKPVAKIYKPILIDQVKINNTKFVIFEDGKDSTKVYTNGLSVKVNGIRIDNKTVTRKIPLDYKSLEAKSDTAFVKVSPYENLTVEDFLVKNRKATFNNIKLKTKYSKRELSRIIHKERDHFDLSLKSLSIDNFDFGFNNNDFFAKSKLITLNAPFLEVFRDKLVADDFKVKPLYSKMLRDLPFELTVDSVNIKNANIKYEERQHIKNMGGSINFKNLNAAISNVSNTYKSPVKTNLNISADFMDNTPFTAEWSFDVQNPEDRFLFKAQVGSVVADKMNSFTEPNLNVRLKGQTHKTYFTIDGNSETSTTDLKINYSNFSVTVLRKDDSTKNKFLSAVANIFVSTNSNKTNHNYREGVAEATRDKTKSIFNFLWISLKNALAKAMTGSGKK